MSSPESARVLAAFTRSETNEAKSVEEDRREWESAVEETNRGLPEIVTPDDLDGVRGEWVAAVTATNVGALVHFHGGGFTSGSPRTHREMGARLSRVSGVPVLLVDYRLAPEHPCPAAVEDGVTAFRWLLGQGLSPDRIALGGDSAGAAVALSVLVQLRDATVPLPAAAYFMSGWFDLSQSGPTYATYAARDPMVSREALTHAAQFYLGNRDPKDPVASPLYADLTGLPPLFIHAGELEVLQGDSLRLAEAARVAGVSVDIKIWDGLWHVFQAWASDVPEARESLSEIGTFVQHCFADRS